MIHFISSRDLIGSSILTSLAFHHCLRPLVPSLAQASPPRLSRLQPVHQAKSCLDLLHLSHTTPCHVSYAMSSFMCEPCNISRPFHLHSIGCSHMMYLWTNHMCISLKDILVHLRLSLNYQNQIRTFQRNIKRFSS
jgi:hypothetical protein